MKKLIYPLYVVEFIFYYLLKLIQANVLMAFFILSPKIQTNSGFIDVPVVLKSQLGILIFSNLLSMTPGTLSTDISADKKILTIHILFKDDIQKIEKDINIIQRKIKRITS